MSIRKNEKKNTNLFSENLVLLASFQPNYRQYFVCNFGGVSTFFQARYRWRYISLKVCFYQSFFPRETRFYHAVLCYSDFCYRMMLCNPIYCCMVLYFDPRQSFSECYPILDELLRLPVDKHLTRIFVTEFKKLFQFSYIERIVYYLSFSHFLRANFVCMRINSCLLLAVLENPRVIGYYPVLFQIRRKVELPGFKWNNAFDTDFNK